MNYYLYFDQLARMKFRVRHPLLEISKDIITSFITVFWLSSGSALVPEKFLERTKNVPHWFQFFSNRFSRFLVILCNSGVVSMPVTYEVISVANKFVHPQTANDCSYHAFAFRELARFTYGLLQKIKKKSSLPLVQQWEEYATPIHFQFPAIEKENFPAGTLVMIALNKCWSFYLKKEFLQETR